MAQKIIDRNTQIDEILTVHSVQLKQIADNLKNLQSQKSLNDPWTNYELTFWIGLPGIVVAPKITPLTTSMGTIQRLDSGYVIKVRKMTFWNMTGYTQNGQEGWRMKDPQGNVVVPSWPPLGTSSSVNEWCEYNVRDQPIKLVCEYYSSTIASGLTFEVFKTHANAVTWHFKMTLAVGLRKYLQEVQQ